jgi:hypothetical protein
LALKELGGILTPSLRRNIKGGGTSFFKENILAKIHA